MCTARSSPAIASGRGRSELATAAERACAYAAEARSRNTRRAYASQVRQYRSWCDTYSLRTDQPGAVALYLAHRADSGASVSTMAQALSAINQAALAAGQPSPRDHAFVRETWAGIRRSKGTAQKQPTPLSPEQLRAISRALPRGVAGLRDRALLLVGYGGALRRSELVALNVGDVEPTAEGLIVSIRRSKTDQERKGRKVGLPFGADPLTCPVRAFRAWLEVSGIRRGAIFRGVHHRLISSKRLHGRDVARIIQRRAAHAGVSNEALSGHSLRAGLVTAAAMAGKPVYVIKAHTGHRSLAVLYRYVRDASLFRDNAAAEIGL